MKNGKKIFHESAASFCNWKDFVLPVAFCICTVILLFAVARPVIKTVAAAADTKGYVAVPSPDALFHSSGLNEDEEEGVVDLAAVGGMPKQGELYGTVAVYGTSLSCNLYYGDSKDELHAGAGTYMGGAIPGQSGAVLIGGHTSTYFRDLENAAEGADIAILTHYGEYHYEVTEMEVILAEEFGEEELRAAPEKSVILYCCYPFGQTATTPYRYLVYGSYVSGPAVLAEEGEEI